MNKKEKKSYFVNTEEFESLIVYPNKVEEKTPVIMIFHPWDGRGSFVEKKAHELGERGYISCAVDMYGKGILPKDTEEKIALMKPLMEDRKKLQDRILSAFSMVKDVLPLHPLGAIGYCFGGLCALDLARSGASLEATVSFHGLLKPPQNKSSKKIISKILLLHGYEDPLVPKEQIFDFATEMKRDNVDWQMHIYSNTSHAFTNPEAHDTEHGLLYNSLSSKRAWQALISFFEEVFKREKII